MNLEEYFSTRRTLLELRLKRVPREVSEEEEIAEIVSYVLEGGKRLRGVLTLLFSEALGGDLEVALDAAVAVEMVHSASLVHDDIIDGDLFRRGKLAAWMKYGISKAILVPHLILSHAQLLVEKYGSEALHMTIEAWRNVTFGEYEDLVRGSHYIPSSYEKIASYKTGELFGVAAALGAIAAGRRDLKELARDYGFNLGFSFQVADDIVDLHKFLTGSLDLRTSPSLNSFIAWIYNGKPYGEVGDEEPLIRAFEKLNSTIESTIEKCSRLLKGIPETRYKRLLVELPKYATNKMLEEGGVVVNAY